MSTTIRRSTRQRKPSRSSIPDNTAPMMMQTTKAALNTPSRPPQNKKRSLLLKATEQSNNNNDLPVVITPPPASASNHCRWKDSLSSEEGFYDLCIPPQEFRPSATLTTGQCFHWTVLQEEDDQRAHNPVDEEEAMNTSKTTTSTPNRQTTKKRRKSYRQTKKESAWGSSNATQWIGVLRMDSQTDIVVILRETPDSVWYKTVYVPAHVRDPSSTVRDYLYSYFRISNPHASHINNNHKNNDYSDDDCSLPTLYQEWSHQCPRMKRIAACIPGVRILQSDPWECFVSFLCSSNNNIPRITQMLQAIRKTYGQPLCPVPYRSISNFKKEEKDGQDNSRTSWIYSFPSLQHLHQTATEQDLRQSCGMGYRAKYLIQSMNQLMTLGGESYLYQLRQQQTKNENNNALNVQNQLIQFSGIGRKVADCIALFSLRQDDAIPVDTHVWNIALRDYANDEEDVASKESSPVVSLRMAKSLTPTVYQRVGDIFRKRFPNKSGWAHSLLFVAELPSFRNVLPPHIVQEMDRFRQEEKAKKQKTRSHPKS